MKSNKVSIYILLFNIIVFGILVLYFNYNKSNGGYIILPDNNVYTMKSGKLQKYEGNIENSNIILVQDSPTKATFSYVDGDLKIYKDNEEVELTDEFKYAYTSDVKIKEVKTKIEDIDYNEYNIIKRVLNDHNIEGYSYLPTAEKITYEDKTLYYISNLFEEQTYDKVFSFVYYLNENNDIIYLEELVTTSNKAYDICVPEFNSVITINGQRRLIMNCNYFSEIGTNVNVYNKNLSRVN